MSDKKSMRRLDMRVRFRTADGSERVFSAFRLMDEYEVPFRGRIIEEFVRSFTAELVRRNWLFGSTIGRLSTNEYDYDWPIPYLLPSDPLQDVSVAEWEQP